MRALILCAALISTPQAVAQGLPDGTVLFVENSNFVVETVTEFSTTHVCIVLDGKVYNAEPPAIRTYTVPEYLALLAKWNGDSKKCKTLVCRPKRPLSPKQIQAMRSFLEGEVGRRYSIRGYVRGVESDGTHCSQLTTEALAATGSVRSQRPWKVSPGTLRDAIQPRMNSKAYWFVEKPDKPKKIAFRRFGDWLYDKSVFCSWSCWETWTFCR